MREPAQFRSTCGPKFCSMEIAQQVRNYAAKLAQQWGMAEISAKCIASCADGYVA